jgi:hypothetical protein
MLAFVIAAAIAAATRVGMEVQTPTVPGWTLTSDEICRAKQVYGPGAMIVFVYEPKGKIAGLTVVDAKFASIVEGHEYRLSVDFLHGSNAKTQRWRDVPAIGTRIKSKPAFMIMSPGDKMLDALSGSLGFVIQRNGKMALMHAYAGSEEVAGFLRRCPQIYGGGSR